MSATSPASVGWSMPAAEDKTLLQKITPIHMGVFLVLVVMMMVVTAGPSSMHATPTRLPALVSGGGTADGIPMQPRAGVVAVNGAANAGAPKARAGTAAAPRAAGRSPRAAVPRARTLRVGSASVPARVHAGGIPSPAAAANLAISGGGRVGAGQTGAVRMNGIPSPAAAAQLGPQKLPFKPSDGVTLPRTVGERDSHAIDTHYSAASLPMEEPAAPVMTPGQSSAYSERQVTLNELTGGTSSANPLPASPAAGGYANAY